MPDEVSLYKTTIRIKGEIVDLGDERNGKIRKSGLLFGLSPVIVMLGNSIRKIIPSARLHRELVVEYEYISSLAKYRTTIRYGVRENDDPNSKYLGYVVVPFLSRHRQSFSSADTIPEHLAQEMIDFFEKMALASKKELVYDFLGKIYLKTDLHDCLALVSQYKGESKFKSYALDVLRRVFHYASFEYKKHFYPLIETLHSDKELNQLKETGRRFSEIFVVGFFRNKAGKVEPVIGGKYFESIMSESDRKNQRYLKEVSLRPIIWNHSEVSNLSLKLSANHLTADKEFMSKLESGIPIVSGVDVYTEAIENDVYGNNHTLEDTLKSELLKYENEMMILYYSHPAEEIGRTGVLVRILNGEIVPITYEKEGLEYLYEIWSVGTASGGLIKRKHHEENYKGTGSVDEGANQFDVLESMNETRPSDSAMPLAFSTYEFEGKTLSQIVRLVPSTVRFGFENNVGFDTFRKSLDEFLTDYANIFVDLMLDNDAPRLIASIHNENIVVHGNGKYSWGDFADHMLLKGNLLPTYDAGNDDFGKQEITGFVTYEKLLRRYLFSLPLLKSYFPDSESQKFNIYINNAFKSKGIDLDIQENDYGTEVAEKIWKRYLCLAVYNRRKHTNYYPDRFIREIYWLANMRFERTRAVYRA